MNMPVYPSTQPSIESNLGQHQPVTTKEELEWLDTHHQHHTGCVREAVDYCAEEVGIKEHYYSYPKRRLNDNDKLTRQRKRVSPVYTPESK